MNPDNRMAKLDAGKDKSKLTQTMKDYMKLIEKQNLDRVQRLQRMRRNNIITGCVIGTGVLGIYLYSILAVKQETFLDDFEEPKLASTS